MNEQKYDINDDEIRIITSAGSSETLPKKGKVRKRLIILIFSLSLIILGGIVWLLILFYSASPSSSQSDMYPAAISPLPAKSVDIHSQTEPESFCSVTDTTVNNIRLRIFTPRFATPSLAISDNVPNDSSIVLAALAADVRGDNGEIAGAFVLKGNLISKGQAKAGFCSIINGELRLGVADATPMLEQALETEGYFFRQYPLVVGGQLVENKPKGKALRKALAEYDGNPCIITSLDRLSFHDFARTLVDLGINNAIYIIGGDSPVIYRDKEGKRCVDGNIRSYDSEYINYVLWK